MVELTGDTALCGALVRELLARGVDVSGRPSTRTAALPGAIA